MTIHAEELTLERIFDSPDLSGPSLRQAELSPAGDRVTFVRAREDDRDLMDLWEYHLADGVTRRLVAADAVVADEGELSEAERARRERARIANLRGIVEYRWSADGRFLIFPLAGDIYLLDLQDESGTVRQITASDSFDTDPKVSSDGEHVAFIRERNLWVAEVASGEARALTEDASETVANGVAEFIAQEEMGRSTGYWWSPDSRRIAFLQIDESPIDITRRYEIEAGEINMIEQRYPYAGTPNVSYRLGLVDLDSGERRWIDLGNDSGDNRDIYIPRVQWHPDGRHLSLQRQSRDQQTLDLILVDTDTLTQRVLLTETSDTWINLHDDLHFLERMDAFIWASERSGFKHLYLYDLEGSLIRPLTGGDWGVDEVVGVDAELGLVYFTGSEVSPQEKHLYRQSLMTSSPEIVSRISRRSGWHEVRMDRAGRVYVDLYSSSSQPPQLSLHSADGERVAWLLENRLDDNHPYGPYRAGHRPSEFGHLVGPEGQKLFYRLIRPADFDPAEQYPVFLYVYGGPTSRLAVNSWGRRSMIEQYMARRGYVVFTLDNRGVERQGKAFQDEAYLKLGQIEMVDQMVGVDWLRSQPWVDPERIGIFGWSYGGYMALMAASQYPGEFAASVAVAPVTDWALYDTHYTERYLSTPQAAPEAYERGNVLSYADAIRDPLLLIHGMADDNVLFTHSTMLMQQLQEQAIDFELMTYPGEKHAISGAGQRLHVYRTLTRFLDRHLRPAGMEPQP
ncbi:S9 family peptidase [Wenzhouxiangella marina]|nr:S9 family peptidase [Wenzhouxiangella marina]MBB6086646.1 dipeptidyl-peptidase-4 [Wenzhouxiangella marina]